jgi:hypothetical protein
MVNGFTQMKKGCMTAITVGKPFWFGAAEKKAGKWILRFILNIRAIS